MVLNSICSAMTFSDRTINSTDAATPTVIAISEEDTFKGTNEPKMCYNEPELKKVPDPDRIGSAPRKHVRTAHPPRRIRKQTELDVIGRRGPLIQRPLFMSVEQEYTTPIPFLTATAQGILDGGSTTLPVKWVSHFKPSLTPGLGTRRLVKVSSSQDTRLRFNMEPRAGEEAFQQWKDAMRRMARIGSGLPASLRQQIWQALADRQLASQHVDWAHVIRLAFNDRTNPDDDDLGSQIVKDLHRTGCEQFGSEEDRAALKRVLLAYARWNKRVGYCQGFNVLAAVILDVTARNEEAAFKIMVYLIDFVLPESYFAQNLQALSVDIAVFRELLHTRLPRLANHLDRLQLEAARETDLKLGLAQSPTSPTASSAERNKAYEPCRAIF